MHTITQLLNGRYRAILRYQDDKEVQEFPDADSAVRWLKDGSPHATGGKLKWEDITFLREEQVVVTRTVRA